MAALLQRRRPPGGAGGSRARVVAAAAVVLVATCDASRPAMSPPTKPVSESGRELNRAQSQVVLLINQACGTGMIKGAFGTCKCENEKHAFLADSENPKEDTIEACAALNMQEEVGTGEVGDCRCAEPCPEGAAQNADSYEEYCTCELTHDLYKDGLPVTDKDKNTFKPGDGYECKESNANTQGDDDDDDNDKFRDRTQIDKSKSMMVRSRPVSGWSGNSPEKSPKKSALKNGGVGNSPGPRGQSRGEAPYGPLSTRAGGNKRSVTFANMEDIETDDEDKDQSDNVKLCFAIALIVLVLAILFAVAYRIFGAAIKSAMGGSEQGERGGALDASGALGTRSRRRWSGGSGDRKRLAAPWDADASKSQSKASVAVHSSARAQSGSGTRRRLHSGGLSSLCSTPVSSICSADADEPEDLEAQTAKADHRDAVEAARRRPSDHYRAVRKSMRSVHTVHSSRLSDQEVRVVRVGDPDGDSRSRRPSATRVVRLGDSDGDSRSRRRDDRDSRPRAPRSDVGADTRSRERPACRDPRLSDKDLSRTRRSPREGSDGPQRTRDRADPEAERHRLREARAADRSADRGRREEGRRRSAGQEVGHQPSATRQTRQGRPVRHGDRRRSADEEKFTVVSDGAAFFDGADPDERRKRREERRKQRDHRRHGGARAHIQLDDSFATSD